MQHYYYLPQFIQSDDWHAVLLGTVTVYVVAADTSTSQPRPIPLQIMK